MKWLFLILLLTNLGIFIWGQDRQETAPQASSTPAPPTQGNLQLLSELDRPTPLPDAAALTTQALPTITLEQEQPRAFHTTPPDEEPLQIPLDQLPQVNDHTQVEQPAAQPSLAPTARATQPKPPEVQRAVYLPPLLPSGPPASKEGIATNQSPPIAPQGPYPCGLLSGIEDELKGYLLIEQLRTRGINAQLTSPQQQEPAYWVLIPPQPTRAQAEFIMNSLINQGYDDTWLVERGELQNAISMGLFTNLENAQKYMTQVARSGLPVELKRQPTTKTGYHIHLPISANLQPNSSAWTQLQNTHPELQLRETRCEAIAPPPPIP